MKSPGNRENCRRAKERYSGRIRKALKEEGKAGVFTKKRGCRKGEHIIWQH